MIWQTINLGSIVKFSYGKGLPEEKRKDGVVPVYGSSGVIDYHEKALITGPGIIVGRKGNVGSVYFEKNDFYPIDTVYYINDVEESICLKFLYYLLNNLSLVKLNSDAAVPGLNRERVLKIKILKPSFPEQEKIADILSSYDDLINTNRRQIQLLEESARLLFREWFVYFRFPGHEKVKIVDGVPEGWVKGAVGNLAKVKSGYAYNSKSWKEEGNPVVKIGNIIGDGTVNLDCCSHIDEDIATKTKDFALIDGDLLIAMTGATIGKVGLLLGKVKTAYLNQRVGKFYPKFDGVELLMYCFFMSDMAQTHITNYAGGAAQPNISASQIESIKIIVATRDIYTQFINLVKPMFEKILILRSQNQKLAQARDLLLPRLMSGAIEV